jgi:hypothetical protein
VVAAHRVSVRRQRFAATYVLPDDLAGRVRQRLNAVDVGLALRGLRQWLRLRILTDKPMGMPSLGVQTALEEFLALEAADFFRRNVFGRRSQDSLPDGVLPTEAAGQTMALTWAMTCNDQQLYLKAPPSLPMLFAVDAALVLPGGWSWVMYCGHEPCAASDTCVHHDVLPYLPEQTPHQVHFDVPRDHQLMDKSDAIFTAGYSAPGTPGIGGC